MTKTFALLASSVGFLFFLSACAPAGTGGTGTGGTASPTVSPTTSP